jgi:hypothetical protein
MAIKTDFRATTRLDRYRIFEILLWWEGACNASVLGDLFNVRRENITKDIKAYRLTHEHQITYDSVAKVYRPAEAFVPIYSSGLAIEYLDVTRRFRGGADDGQGLHSWLDSGPRPHIEPDPALFRALVQSIRQRAPMVVRYRSWNHPNGQDRRIHPHALAYSGLRWHCRAFDETTASYRDFHLGRFERYQKAEVGTAITGEQDDDWGARIAIELVPNPALSEDERFLVRADYGLNDGPLIVHCRRAMAHYVLRSYQVDPHATEHHQVRPRTHPLILGNPQALLPYLPERTGQASEQNDLQSSPGAGGK